MAAPQLTKLLKNVHPRVREYSAEALAKIGPGAVPALTRALKGTERQVRDVAAIILGRIKDGPSGESTGKEDDQ